MKPTHACHNPRPSTEQVSGLIERVTFHNDESGFCVLRVKASGQRDEVTVVGSLPSVTVGEWLSVLAVIENRPSELPLVGRKAGADRAGMAGGEASP